MRTTIEQIQTALASAYPITVLVSPEEERLERLLGRFAAAAKPQPLSVNVWNCVDGFINGDGPDLAEPMDALAWISDQGPPGLYLLKDLGEFLDDRQLLRRLRDTSMKIRNTGRFLFLLKQDAILPDALKPLSYVVLSLFPDEAELEELVRTMLSDYTTSEEEFERLVELSKA